MGRDGLWFSVRSSHSREELKDEEQPEEYALRKDACNAPRTCFLFSDSHIDKHI